MRRPHDMGGRTGDGAVKPVPDGIAPYDAPWHRGALGLTLAAGALGAWSIDRSRHMREELPEYARLSYYEKWIAALADLLVEKGLVSRDELAAGHADAMVTGVTRSFNVCLDDTLRVIDPRPGQTLMGLTILVAEDATVAQGSGATTSWAVPVNLLENTRYYWRVRAKDQFTFGPYSTPACDFFVNTVNEAPGVPRINTPAFGSQVNALRPDLTVDNASDPDEDVLTYTFEVYRDPALSNLVASQANVAAGTTTTTWTVSTDLMEDHTYYWRVRATDPDALSGDWSSTGQFFVTTVNAVPEAPALVSPQNGTTMANVRPELVILNADDSDLDPLVYDWELATDDTFATVIDSGTDVAPQGAVNTAFALAADLTEDTTYCWRARSDDGQATSGYNTACFLVSETNGAPTVPTLNNPSDNMGATTTTPVFSWAPSTDPEEEAITYEIEVKDDAGTIVGSVMGVSGTVTSISAELTNRATYTWRARATDRSGASSAFSPENTFTVNAPVDDPEVVVDAGGCQTSSAPGTGSLIALGLGLVGLLRRRRR